MVIAVSVTPWPVAPLAVPAPHGEASVPNVAAAADGDLLPAVSAPVTGPPARCELPHAAAVRAKARTTAPAFAVLFILMTACSLLVATGVPGLLCDTE